jgi:hypothetical protein
MIGDATKERGRLFAIPQRIAILVVSCAVVLPLSSAEANWDGCQKPHQACRCGNTGWAGYCDYGPHHEGLYCRCD